MPRLFVDCDDTLVLWDKAETAEGVYRGDMYEINRMLAGNINCWLDVHPEYELVVWSGGGTNYALRWANLAFGSRRSFEILPKDMRIPQGDDICIDDMHGELKPRDNRVKVVGPDVRRCPICNAE